jgi:cytochrome P450
MAVMYLGITVVLGVILLALLFRRKKPVIIGYHCSDKEHGNFAEIVKAGGLHEFIVNSHKRLGPVFEFWLGKRRVVSLSGFEMWKAVKHLVDKPFEGFASFVPLVGTKGVSFANGAEYTRRKKLIHASVLSVASLHQNLVPKLNALIADDVLPYFEAAASTGQPTKLDEVVVGFTVSAIVYLIGSQAHKEDVRIIIDCQNFVVESLCARVFGKVLSKDEVAEFEIKLALIKSVMKKVIAEGKVSERPTLLKVYANESEEVINDEMMGFLVGGFHTTSYLIQWSLYLAAKHPEEQEKLYRELISVEGELSSKLESLPVLRNFVDEALRWAGISTMTAREDMSNDIVLPGGFVISKGTFIMLSTHQILHDETLWDRPEDFIPDRFNISESRGLKYYGFGFAGGRTCPGKSMALTEAKIFIAEVFRRFTFTLPTPDYSVRKSFVFTVHPEDPIELIVKGR